MAYKNNAGGEHAFKRLDKELKNDGLKNLLLFYGKEEYLIQWAIDAIVNRYVNPACRELDFFKLDGPTVTVDQIIQNCETLAMMSRQRVVLIRDFKLLEGTKTKSIGEDDEKRLADYLKNLPDSCMLILTSENTDKRKKLLKVIAETGSVYEFNELDERSLKSFIEKKFKEAGKTAKAPVIAEFIASSGYYDKETDYTLYNLDNDIKKAVAHTEGNEILLKDIKDTVSGNLDTNVFSMMDSLSKGRKEEAYQLLHNLLLSGEKEYMLLSLICSNFELILSVKEMREEGCSLQDMKDYLGIHEFRIRKAMEFSERFSLKHLTRVLQKAYEVDKNIKTGFLDSSLALEMFIAEI
ncbi:DNA polymerase III subunit delta [Sinanaerobacter chloroacetimidivorans]|jgi:DNA polymerase-3 subunit delta|uniref:DNA polymerase III subunit delta n=1 Tax=Sinanaerobacter chloroacetimidivorans TaxID=2818044 RepID=A0A8J8B382_9FIRM|nr:DNA polymerase III subunit delta [Sinanaerobacter chloroacetimidivorans]MBR0599516.1 DNA polymerase III subunit delta [Sinanaerobacter chloroacetimidivorans]